MVAGRSPDCPAAAALTKISPDEAELRTKPRSFVARSMSPGLPPRPRQSALMKLLLPEPFGPMTRFRLGPGRIVADLWIIKSLSFTITTLRARGGARV